MHLSVMTPALTSGAPAPLTPRVGGADSAQRRDAASCDRCGIVGAHACAFRTVAVNTFCTRCARWVGTDHVCDGAHCVVCDQHGVTLAGHGHAVPVDLSPPKREWAR